MVRNVLGMTAGGYTVEQVLDAYPDLTREDVSAALRLSRWDGSCMLGAWN
jgi:uncharacterized protein (DUF433 family)